MNQINLVTSVPEAVLGPGDTVENKTDSFGRDFSRACDSLHLCVCGVLGLTYLEQISNFR